MVLCSCQSSHIPIVSGRAGQSAYPRPAKLFWLSWGEVDWDCWELGTTERACQKEEELLGWVQSFPSVSGWPSRSGRHEQTHYCASAMSIKIFHLSSLGWVMSPNGTPLMSWHGVWQKLQICWKHIKKGRYRQTQWSKTDSTSHKICTNRRKRWRQEKRILGRSREQERWDTPRNILKYSFVCFLSAIRF